MWGEPAGLIALSCGVLLVKGDGKHRLAGQLIQARGNSGFDDIRQHLVPVVYVHSV